MSEILTKKSIGLIHKIYYAQLKNKKHYTACTKTRAEVRGGGRKPWKQKGTGQARAGSSRSPIWVGGGVSFGPRPHVVFKKINKKERRLALYTALNLKKKNIIKIPDSCLDFSEPKTKCLAQIVKNLNISSSEKVLLVVQVISTNLKLACKNLRNVNLIATDNLCLEKLLSATKIILTEKAYNLIK